MIISRTYGLALTQRENSVTKFVFAASFFQRVSLFRISCIRTFIRWACTYHHQWRLNVEVCGGKYWKFHSLSKYNRINSETKRRRTKQKWLHTQRKSQGKIILFWKITKREKENSVFGRKRKREPWKTNCSNNINGKKSNQRISTWIEKKPLFVQWKIPKSENAVM